MKSRIIVSGMVQGIGFRPFVAKMAEKYKISGTVCNSGGTVHIVVCAALPVAEKFAERIRGNAPKGAFISNMEILEEKGKAGEEEETEIIGFSIISSEEKNREESVPILAPDFGICPACAEEMERKSDRRYRYPFISCTACGPRYSILKKIPYDRNTTSMDRYSMCPECKEEYTSMAGRRRHAQTISCHNCGPQLLFRKEKTFLEKEEALKKAIDILNAGGILALKGIGGYQYLCRPDCRETVKRLRKIKGREEKPFAVMFPELSAVEKLAFCSEEEKKLLLSPARPIVLLEKRQWGEGEREAEKKEDLERYSIRICEETAGRSRFLGAFLPNVGIHLLLLRACGPLIVTSANKSGEPILWREGEETEAELEKADGILYHDREILAPLDDSVARVFDGKIQLIRRSRGYVPFPVFIRKPCGHRVFAAGGDLKAAFALASQDSVYLSQYLGDMESASVQELYGQTVNRMKKLFDIEEDIMVCDCHPGYFTSRNVETAQRAKNGKKELESLKPAAGGKTIMRVQHHKAHAASVMAEHGLTHAIGVVFDGTGYGDDGSIWGGEIFLCQKGEWKRAAHLYPEKMCGGDALSRRAWQSALCCLAGAGIEKMEDIRKVLPEIKEQEARLLLAARRAGVSVTYNSSMGRLFDAVAAMTGCGTENIYEGFCATELENLAAMAKKRRETPYPLTFFDQDEEVILKSIDLQKDSFCLNTPSLIRQCFQAVTENVEPGRIALGFHEAVTEAVLKICMEVRKQTGENNVSLSGGCFANLLLMEGCVKTLRSQGFSVYWNKQVPCNDGGIALGQVYLVNQQKESGQVRG